MSINIIRPLWSHLDELVRPQGSIDYIETVARRRSAVLLSGFGFGHVREYAPFGPGVALVPYGTLPSSSGLASHPSFKASTHLIKCARAYSPPPAPAEGSDLEMGLSDPSVGIVRVFYIYLYTGLQHYVP